MIKRTLKDTIIHSFIGGIFQGLGLTVGIALIAYFLSFIVNAIGGLPFVGDMLANVVNATLEALKHK
jgi:uncharacterized membrane protein required for colicin V production